MYLQGRINAIEFRAAKMESRAAILRVERIRAIALRDNKTA